MKRAATLFPAWAILISVAAYMHPEFSSQMEAAIVPLLIVIMFGMGVTLTPEDFSRVLNKPRLIAFGVLLQYTIMPLAAFLIAKLLKLSPELTAGIVLLGSSPGGTASNVICYLARADVALSITLTMSSTLLAVVATPVLTWVYAGQAVPVPVLQMLVSVLKIVLVPVVAGVAINTLLGPRIDRIKPLFPAVSMAAIVLIIGIIVGLNQPKLASIGVIVITAVVLHNGLGLLAGYWAPRALGYDQTICRTFAIEVGMQNSGLSVALAVKYFSAAAALPGALFSIWHNLSGSFLASAWAAKNSAKD